MSYTFLQIVEKINAEKSVLVFTPDESGSGDRHVRYGFYEIKNCSFGPVMFRFFDEHWCDGTIYSRVAVRIKNSNFEDSVVEIQRDNFNVICYFLQKAQKEKARISARDAINRWNNFLKTPNPESRLNVRPSTINALKSFEAIMTVVNRHRPYEPSDFVAESFIPDLER